MKEFRAGPVRVVEKVSDTEGPIFLRLRGDIVSIVVTEAWANGLHKCLVPKDKGVKDPAFYVHGCEELRDSGPRMCAELVEGRRKIIWVSRYEAVKGALISPRYFAALLVSFPFLDRFNWRELEEAW
jgi:hypothetical protein